MKYKCRGLKQPNRHFVNESACGVGSFGCRFDGNLILWHITE